MKQLIKIYPLFLVLLISLLSGSCNEMEEEEKEKGCTNPSAINFNPDAMEDDGSCLLSEVTYGMETLNLTNGFEGFYNNCRKEFEHNIIIGSENFQLIGTNNQIIGNPFILFVFDYAFSEVNNLSGTYQLNNNSKLYEVSICLSQGCTDEIIFDSGEVTINPIGNDSYAMSFNLSNNIGNTASGQYEGRIDRLNYELDFVNPNHCIDNIVSVRDIEIEVKDIFALPSTEGEFGSSFIVFAGEGINRPENSQDNPSGIGDALSIQVFHRSIGPRFNGTYLFSEGEIGQVVFLKNFNFEDNSGDYIEIDLENDSELLILCNPQRSIRLSLSENNSMNSINGCLVSEIFEF